MPPSEVEKIFPAFAESRKAELPRFTPDSILITPENKFDDAIYNYLYAYWKEYSGKYDPKGNVVASNTANHLSLGYKTENELRFAQWAMREYGMTNKERTTHTFKGQMSVLLEVWNVVDMITLPISLVSAGGKFIGKEVAKEVGEELGEKAVKEVAGETTKKVTKTVFEIMDDVYILYRKKKNTGSFKDLDELMQLRNVKDIAKRAGIGLNGIKIKIDRNPELIGKDIYGFTDGKTIILYPDAFTSTETLVKTLGHERMHVYQVAVFGKPTSSNMLKEFEKAAFNSEKTWWDYYNLMMKGRNK